MGSLSILVSQPYILSSHNILSPSTTRDSLIMNLDYIYFSQVVNYAKEKVH